MNTEQINDELHDWPGPPIPIDSLKWIGTGGERAIEALCMVRRHAGENNLEQIVRQVIDLTDPDALQAKLYRIGFFSTMEVILSSIDMDHQQMMARARLEGVF